jgi:hypothetical protein
MMRRIQTTVETQDARTTQAAKLDELAKHLYKSIGMKLDGFTPPGDKSRLEDRGN